MTPAQQKTLEAIKEHGEARYAHYMGRFGGGYWYVPNIGRCTRQVEALIKAGHLTVKPDGFMGDKTATVRSNSNANQN